jgi:hypothetical protein
MTFEGGLHEACKKRMWCRGTTLKFRVKLAPQEVRVVLELHNLDKFGIGGCAGENKTRAG